MSLGTEAVSFFSEESRVSFCPDWVFDIAVSQTAKEFLSSEITINAVSVKYADGLSEKYSPIDKALIEGAAEDLLLFLSEVNAGEEAVEFLNGFSYFKYSYESVNKPRKLTPLFGMADDPVKTIMFSGESALKHFKAYVFGLRSNSAPTAPAGWTLDLAGNTLHVAEISRRQISILDAF